MATFDIEVGKEGAKRTFRINTIKKFRVQSAVGRAFYGALARGGLPTLFSMMMDIGEGPGDEAAKLDMVKEAAEEIMKRADFDPAKLGGDIAEALESLPDEAIESVLRPCALVLTSGETEVLKPLNSEDALGEVFEGRVWEMYVLLGHAIAANKFLPFGD